MGSNQETEQMDNPIERAARALCEERVRAGLKSDWTSSLTGRDFEVRVAEFVERDWHKHLASARAVIAAIREPSAEQIDRFVSRALCVSVHGEGGWSAYGRGQWQTMIDALLSDTPPCTPPAASAV